LGFVRRALARELERLPFWLDFDLSPEMIAFGAVLAVVAAVVIGLLPALKATASFARPGLGALDHRNRKQLGPMWTMLVVAQVAFSFAALPSAIELAWGVLREAVLGPGFEAGQYLTAQLSFDVDGATRSLETDPQIATQFNDARSALIRQLEADPRVTTRVTTATAVPGEGTWTRIRVEEAPESNAGPEESGVRSGPSLAQSVRIDDRYFEAFDISILTGRAFQAGEYGATSTAVTSSSFTLSVRVMVALRVWGVASLPIANSPCNMIHSVVSSRSALLAKVSLPSMDRPPSAGGLTSSTTSLSFAMMTLSPATGTLRFGQVAGSDQRLAAGEPAF
jgi:hypothetical protein